MKKKRTIVAAGGAIRIGEIGGDFRYNGVLAVKDGEITPEGRAVGVRYEDEKE